MSITIYHNPRCSKSRQTLALIRERGVEPEIVEYLKTPPTPDEIKRITERLGCPVREIIRSGEPEYRELALDEPSLGDEELIARIAEQPKLLQRPIVLTDAGACIGRPPENVEALLK
jgi:arsenate reductase